MTDYTYALLQRNTSKIESQLIELKNQLIHMLRIGDCDRARELKSEILTLENHYRNTHSDMVLVASNSIYD